MIIVTGYDGNGHRRTRDEGPAHAPRVGLAIEAHDTRHPIYYMASSRTHDIAMRPLSQTPDADDVPIGHDWTPNGYR